MKLIEIINMLNHLTNKFGWYNLDISNKFRYVKELYEETRSMIKIQPIVEEVLEDFESVINVTDNLDSVSGRPKLFQYWHHGFDDLPGLVKNCYKSVDYFLGDDFEIIRIDYTTLNQYIDLNASILLARNEERMTIAHFSDIVRNKLLFEYGGMWLDSTVLITGRDSIMEFISLNNRLMFSRFVFSNPKEHAVQFESWIMWSRNKGNLAFKLADEVLVKFWSVNKTVINYFLYHIILTIIFLRLPKLRESFNWHDRLYCGNSFDLGRYLIAREYDVKELSSIMKKTDIHKLDFKQNKIDRKLFGGKFFDESFWFDVLEIKKLK